jgi:hypothetical protein
MAKVGLGANLAKSRWAPCHKTAVQGSSAGSCGCGKGITVSCCMAYPLLRHRKGDLVHHPGCAALALIHNF